MSKPVTFWRRIALAFVAFFAVLFNRAFAEEVNALRAGEAPQLPPSPEAPPEGARTPEPPAQRGALYFLSILQRDGRLIDFLQEDLSSYSDEEIGGAARTVHEGCRKALGNYLALEPVFAEPDGATIDVPSGFDAAAIRLTGNVVGEPPFRGSLKHHGWRAASVSLPSAPDGHDPKILAPAEVELP
jgi:hypothetical protein